MIFQEKFKTGLKDIGKNNLIKNRAILEILEDIGSYHSDIAGYGANDTEKNGLTWILLDWKIEVLDRPKYGQALEVHTWAKVGNKFFTYRDYEIYDENHKLRAIATSKWALINIQKEKMERITPEIFEPYHPEQNDVFPGEKLDKLEVPENFTNKISYQVIRKDIDINHHMHNLYYLDLAYEALPEEIYEKRPFNHVRITYKKEIKLGDTVSCKYALKDGKHVVVIESEEGKILNSVIELY